MGFVTALLMAGCADNELVTAEDNGSQQTTLDDPTGTPILFAVGNLNQAAVTRADVIPYMTRGGRFVCTMYYHSGSTDTDNSDFDIKHPEVHTTWLKVNNNVGNSVYRKNTFNVNNEATDIDAYGFDKTAVNFYWQNRLTHAFLALTDYNKLTTIDGDISTVKLGKLKMYPYHDKDMVTLPDDPTEEDIETYANTLADNRYANTYDLTKGDKTSMSEQPDPILALTIMKPAGATQEANRVRLYFKHQFSQIQVNLKAADDNSASITSSHIEKVELLGVSEEGYVFCRLNAGGTVGTAKFEAVNLESYTDAELEANPWGTSFEMFDMAPAPLQDVDGNGIDDRYADGYLKSFNAIAYGYLWAIRITWHEDAHTEIKHVATYEVPQDTGEPDNIPLRQLQSGRRYIYNLELRRGTLAVIRTQIIDWQQDEELVYGTDGTITN